MIRNFQPFTQHTLLLCQSVSRLQSFGLIRPDLFQQIISRYQYGIALNSSVFPLIWFQRQKRQTHSTVPTHAPQLYFNFSFLFNLTTSPQGDKVQSIQTSRSHTSSLPPAIPSLLLQTLSFRLNQSNSSSLISVFNLRLLQSKVPVHTPVTPAISSGKVLLSGLLIDNHLLLRQLNTLHPFGSNAYGAKSSTIGKARSNTAGVMVRRILERSQQPRLSPPSSVVRPFPVPQGSHFILAHGAMTVTDTPSQEMKTNRQPSPQPWAVPATLDWVEGLSISASVGDPVLPLTQRPSRRISQQLFTRQPSIIATTADLRVIGAQPEVEAFPTSSPPQITVRRSVTNRPLTAPTLDQPVELSYSRSDAPIKQAISTLKANLAEMQTYSTQQLNALANTPLQPSQASRYELPPAEVNRIADQVYNTIERKLRTEKERRGR